MAVAGTESQVCAHAFGSVVYESLPSCIITDVSLCDICLSVGLFIGCQVYLLSAVLLHLIKYQTSQYHGCERLLKKDKRLHKWKCGLFA